ncbi:hypothetical protein R6Q57_016369 [Mikania cordata]
MTAIIGEDTPWSRLFEMTFAPHPRAADQPQADPGQPEVSFRLCGDAYAMSLAEFGNALGLYTEEELTMPIYTSAIHTADDAVVSAWWPRIGDEPFVRAARVTRIRDPLIRYLHRVIASPCNVARCLAEYFSTYYHHQERGLIFGGVYVTRLARANALIDVEPAGMRTLAASSTGLATSEGGHLATVAAPAAARAAAPAASSRAASSTGLATSAS